MTTGTEQRPDWLIAVNREGESMDLAAVVPMDPEELISTAMRAEQLANFGRDDYWREPFHVLVESLNSQADLSLFGRIGTRDMLLTALRNRLRVEDVFARNPAIEDEVIHEPVILVGLPRSGTSILFEVLMQDPDLAALLAWEVESPCPPPEAGTYADDPRIPRAHERITRRTRLAPRMQAMHELGARIPAECGTAHTYFSFLSESVLGRYNLPAYDAYLTQRGDLRKAYGYHKRLLKLLQWKNPRRHWLLKSPPYLWHLDVLLETFPDARVIISHRDPLRALSSGTSLIVTMRGMWSDRPVVDPAGFALMLDPATIAAGLEGIIDLIEAGAIPRGQVLHSHYAQFMQDPIAQVRELYDGMGLALTDQATGAMRAYLAGKPQGKFGTHAYAVVDDPGVRRLFARYQAYFNVENEG
ncbi:MAG: sulfotransferase [Gammaproteobacteria bacterium]